MIAFQKYCQVHQTKMYFLTSFLGLMTFLMFVTSCVLIIKNGMEETLLDPVAMSSLIDFPAALMLMLMLHKLFNLYIKGHFFTSHTLKVLQTVAKLAIFFGLLLKPSIELSLMYFFTDASLTLLNYFGAINLPIVVVGYVLHIGTAAHKISRDIEQEQELTV